MTKDDEIQYIKARFGELAAEHEKRTLDLKAAIKLVFQLRSALTDLVDVQNGAPLHTYKEAWDEAMEAASHADARAGVFLAKFGYTRPFSPEEMP